MTNLIEPHGGALKVLYVPADQIMAEKKAAVDLPTWNLTARQLCDIKLILTGAFSPLEGFLGEEDYACVLKGMRLADGILWPIPVTLDVTEAAAENLEVGTLLSLADPEGQLVAVMTVSSIWRPDHAAEAQAVFGSTDQAHPGVDHLLNRTHPVYVGGRLKGVQRPVDYDFKQLRDEPADLRRRFERWGWSRIVAFQTRNPMHRAHQELTFRAAQMAEANLLIHPVVGITRPGDIDHFARVRCYEHILKRYPEQTTLLSILPLAMRMAGPREAVWHAIIRKNHGCTHFIVGRDHAGPGDDSAGKPFYEPYAAQKLLRSLQDELGIEMMPFQEMVYVQDRGQYVPKDEMRPGETQLKISNSEFRRRLLKGLDVPDWFSFPEVIAELRRHYPPLHKQGFTVFFTGLSGAGKSTVANALMVRLMEQGGRSVTLLDGDIVRKNLSSELGFSKEHRNINILRIGYVASEITKAGGVAICAPIAPYTSIRRQVREMVEAVGTFVEVYVSTSLATCEARDHKGLYAKARAGVIKQFTGIDDPYEEPEKAELVIDTADYGPDEAAQRILLRLERIGLIK